jgi:hypothetical protein
VRSGSAGVDNGSGLSTARSRGEAVRADAVRVDVKIGNDVRQRELHAMPERRSHERSVDERDASDALIRDPAEQHARVGFKISNAPGAPSRADTQVGAYIRRRRTDTQVGPYIRRRRTDAQAGACTNCL